MAAVTDLPPVGDPRFLERVRETLQALTGTRGNPGLTGVRWQDLSRMGLVTALAGSSGGIRGGISPGIGGGSSDTSPPPDVEGFTAGAGVAFIGPSWTLATYRQGHGPAQVNIYAVRKDRGATAEPEPTFADSTLLTTAPHPQTFCAVAVEPNSRYHLWAKHQSVDGVESLNPAGGTHGVTVETGVDVSDLLSVLTGAITRNEIAADVWRTNVFAIAPPEDVDDVDEVFPFIVKTTDETVNGVLVPKGVYMDSAYVVNLQAMVARLGEAWIDSAMVAELSAAHLTAGDGTIGGPLKSASYVTGSDGWIVQPDGFAEFSDVVMRGTIYASAGSIGSISIFSDSIKSGNYDEDEGTGFAFDGATGAIHAYSGTFGGALSGATGTFSGALSAATGTFSGALSAATGTFEGALNGATGTFSGSLTASAVNAVNTINLAGNAVIVPVAVENSSTVDVYETSGVSSVISVSMDTDGYPVYIHASSSFLIDTSLASLTADATVTFYLKVNGATKKTRTFQVKDGSPSSGSFSIAEYISSPGSAEFSISLHAAINVVPDSPHVWVSIPAEAATIFALGCKNNI